MKTSGIVFKKCINLYSIPIYAFNGRILINLYNPHNMTENNDTQQIISIETEKKTNIPLFVLGKNSIFATTNRFVNN